MERKVSLDREPISPARQLVFGIIWGTIFFVLTAIFLVSAGFSVAVVTELLKITHDDQIMDQMTGVFFGILIGGSLLSGLVGAVLGAMGILPGARKKK